MNKEKIIEDLFYKGYPFVPLRKSVNSQELIPPSDGEITCKQYVKRLLDILEESENHGLKIDDDKLISYLKIPEGATSATSQEAAITELNRRQQLMATLRETTFIPIKKIADWAEEGVKWQKREFWFVGIFGTVIIGLLAFLLPYIHSLKSSKEPVEPIKVQIIQQSTPQNQSEPITPENSTVVVPTEIL